MSSLIHASQLDEFEHLEMMCNSISEDVLGSYENQSKSSSTLQSQQKPTFLVARDEFGGPGVAFAEDTSKPCLFSFMNNLLKKMDAKKLPESSDQTLSASFGTWRRPSRNYAFSRLDHDETQCSELDIMDILNPTRPDRHPVNVLNAGVRNRESECFGLTPKEEPNSHQCLKEKDYDTSDFSSPERPVRPNFPNSTLSDCWSLTHKYSDAQDTASKMLFEDFRPTDSDTIGISKDFYKVKPLTDLFPQNPSHAAAKEIPVDGQTLDETSKELKSFESITIHEEKSLVEDDCGGDFHEDSENNEEFNPSETSITGNSLDTALSDMSLDSLNLTYKHSDAQGSASEKLDRDFRSTILDTRAICSDFYEIEPLTDYLDQYTSRTEANEFATNSLILDHTRNVSKYFESPETHKVASLVKDGCDSELSEELDNDESSSIMDKPVPRIITRNQDYSEDSSDDDSSSAADESLPHMGFTTKNQAVGYFYSRLVETVDSSFVMEEPVTLMGFVNRSQGGGDFYESLADDEASLCSSDNQSGSITSPENPYDWTEDDYEHEYFGFIDYPTDDEYVNETSILDSVSLGSQSEKECLDSQSEEEEEDSSDLLDESTSNSTSLSNTTSERGSISCDASSVSLDRKVDGYLDDASARPCSSNCDCASSSESDSRSDGASSGKSGSIGDGASSGKSGSIGDGASSGKSGSVGEGMSSMKAESSRHGELSIRSGWSREIVSSRNSASSSHGMSSRESGSSTISLSLRGFNNCPLSSANGSRTDVPSSTSAFNKDCVAGRIRSPKGASSSPNGSSSDSFSSRRNASAIDDSSNKSYSDCESSDSSGSYSDDTSSSISKFRVLEESSYREVSEDSEESSSTSGSWTCESSSSGELEIGECHSYNYSTHQDSLSWEDISSEVYDSSSDENFPFCPLITTTDEE